MVFISILGLCIGPLFAAQGVYVTIIAIMFAKAWRLASATVVPQFFLTFSIALQLSQGNFLG